MKNNKIKYMNTICHNAVEGKYKLKSRVKPGMTAASILYLKSITYRAFFYSKLILYIILFFREVIFATIPKNSRSES